MPNRASTYRRADEQDAIHVVQVTVRVKAKDAKAAEKLVCDLMDKEPAVTRVRAEAA